MSTNKLICEGCGWHGVMDQMLTAPNPFEAGDEIHGCPTCHAVGCLVYACEHEGCWKEVSCGTPVGEEYAQTCGLHVPKQGTRSGEPHG